MKLKFYLYLIIPIISFGGIKPSETTKKLKSIDSLIFIGDYISANRIINSERFGLTETKSKKLFLNRKAVILYKQKKIIESFSILKSNLIFFKSINDKNEQCYILNLIGNLYFEFNHIELAEYNYLEAEKFARTDEVKEVIYFNLVNIYTLRKDLKRYRFYISLLERLYKKDVKNNQLLLKIKIYKLDFLHSIKKTKSLEFEQELKNIELLIKTTKNEYLNLYYEMLLSINESNKGNQVVSVRIINNVINKFDELYYESDKLHALQIKSDILNNAGDYKNAFLTLEELNEINNQRTSLVSKDIIEDFNNFIESANKEKERLEYRNKINKKNSLLLVGSILILLFLIAIISFYKFKLKQKEIEIKSNEVDALKLIIDTEEKERNRIAIDIHDGLGGLLSVAKIQLSSNNYLQIENLIDKIIIETKSISNNLTSELISNKNLVEVINDYIILINQHNISIGFQTVNFEQLNNKNLNVTIYRIIQELLANTIKHAKASEVLIQLSRFEKKVQITIEDNGIGFNSSKHKSGSGLINIKRRVNLYKGNVDINSKLNEGTSIFIELNIENEK